MGLKSKEAAQRQFRSKLKIYRVFAICFRSIKLSCTQFISNDNPAATAKEQDLRTTLEAVYEFYMRGFDFAPIDLYESDESKFLIVGDRQLRPPFVSLSGLGEAAARDLAAARVGGREFISVEELSRACPKLSQAHIEQLKSVGALSSLPDESQMSLF